jgi:acetyltransferase/esterase
VIGVIGPVKRSYGERVDVKIDDVVRPGATLHVESRGDGPLLLLVVGGNGDCAVFDGLAAALADRFRVVTWVRRGFARSPVDGPVGDKLAADVEDAVALIGSAGPAYVLGSSSGAIMALHLLARHPELVTTLVAHEPPLFGLLPDGDAVFARLDAVHQRFRTDGLGPAMAEFGAAMGIDQSPPPPDAPPPSAEAVARAAENFTFWFGHEFEPYPRAVPDLDALAAVRDRLVLGVGRSSRDAPPARPNAVLAERFGRPTVEFPGGHVGYAEAPEEFAEVLVKALGR